MPADDQKKYMYLQVNLASDFQMIHVTVLIMLRRK